MSICSAPTTGDAFVSGILNFIDCQAQSIGAGGYLALASSNSAASTAAASLITLFIALFGFRMMMGRTPELSETVLAAVKVGIVLLLATSWPAYRIIAYDVVLRGPAEIAGVIGRPADLPGSNGGLAMRLQNADNMVVALARRAPTTALMGTGLSPEQQDIVLEQRTIGFSDDLAFGLARIVYLAGAIGALAIVRLSAGILLALAPLFAALLLFESTRGWFFGWARGLIASALSALGVAIVLGVELALFEPWLADALARHLSRIPTPAAPTELLVMTIGFAIALFGVVGAATRVAFALHVPASWRAAQDRVKQRVLDKMVGTARQESGALEPRDPAPSRAFAIADAISTIQRRELSIKDDRARGVQLDGTDGSVMHPVTGRLGQSFRRSRNRMSPGNARRDSRA